MNISHGDVIDMLRRASKAAGSEREYARLIGVSSPYLSQVINGRRLPGPAVLRHLGLRRVKTPPPPPEYERE